MTSDNLQQGIELCHACMDERNWCATNSLAESVVSCPQCVQLQSQHAGWCSVNAGQLVAAAEQFEIGISVGQSEQFAEEVICSEQDNGISCSVQSKKMAA